MVLVKISVKRCMKEGGGRGGDKIQKVYGLSNRQDLPSKYLAQNTLEHRRCNGGCKNI